jgi:hypothetical protein
VIQLWVQWVQLDCQPLVSLLISGDLSAPRFKWE